SVYSLSRLRKSGLRDVNFPADFSEHGAATLAHRGIVLVLAHVGRKIPTAFALLPRSFAHLHHHRRVAIPRSFFYFHAGDDKEVAQLALEALQRGEHRIKRGQRDLRL